MPDMNMQTYEELQRHQLVTEFDIQSQSELDGYQVKLANVSNPTQAQDNLVVGVDGESLPHWNENVDFDTWVKMRIETSGKHVILIHGNDGLSSGSDIDDTMIFGDEFDSFDSLKWTKAEDNGLVSYANSILTISGSIETIKSIDAFSAGTIIETVGIANNDDIWVGLSPYPTTADWLLIYRDISNFQGYSKSGTNQEQQADGVHDNNYHAWKIERISSSSVKYYQDDSLFATQSNSLYIPSADLPLSIRSWTSANSQSYKWIFVRKYTATEPTVQISTPKNISTALKSFGRAG